MIPVHLKLSGFLSYCDPVEVDFTSFDLACISGPNGAGKSSLLDAITWALFGQARKRDESLINNNAGVKAALVAFTFLYETNRYRVVRSLPRGKTTMLEFQIQQSAGSNSQPEWRTLTERTLRETQARIEQILRLDYDTFVNAAFFLQGRADQFTQQSPGKRKEILSNILGLEVWETYRERAAERRKISERELDAVNGRLEEIKLELEEETDRKKRLAELEAQLETLAFSRRTQENALANLRQARAALDKQRELVQQTEDVIMNARAGLSRFQIRLVERQTERDSHANLLDRAAEIEAGYLKWQADRLEVQRWDSMAAQFREYESRRQPLLEEIATEQARIEQEQETLLEQEKAVSNQSSLVVELREKLEVAKKSLEEIEDKLKQKAELGAQVQADREKQAEMRVENEQNKEKMDELKARIDRLDTTEGAVCPLCSQPLNLNERETLVKQLKDEGKELGDKWRNNRTAIKVIIEQIINFEVKIKEIASAEKERLTCSNSVTQLSERLETLEKQKADWEKIGAKRLQEITRWFDYGKYHKESHKKLAKLDKELATLGYEAVAHDAAHKVEMQSRKAEGEYRALETARAALKPINNEIDNLQLQISNLQPSIIHQQSEYDSAVAALSAAESQAPDLESVERDLFSLQERENQFNQEVGAARQKVMVLDVLRERKSRLEAEKTDLALQIGRYKTLERAFSKDGVPALLIEQALPEIESKANELLDRLSDGTMSVRFVTQAEYKDKSRAELRETLDILISDGAGVRDYEMYSGGEAFRVNFAIRLALSKVLAHRKGARLQTLVVDEGFGSQDAQGRQRLIEAINLVRGDFAKILVITHLDELKDVFPTRIEVEKTERGSTVKVI